MSQQKLFQTPGIHDRPAEKRFLAETGKNLGKGVHKDGILGLAPFKSARVIAHVEDFHEVVDEEDALAPDLDVNLVSVLFFLQLFFVDCQKPKENLVNKSLVIFQEEGAVSLQKSDKA